MLTLQHCVHYTHVYAGQLGAEGGGGFDSLLVLVLVLALVLVLELVLVLVLLH